MHRHVEVGHDLEVPAWSRLVGPLDGFRLTDSTTSAGTAGLAGFERSARSTRQRLAVPAADDVSHHRGRMVREPAFGGNRRRRNHGALWARAARIPAAHERIAGVDGGASWAACVCFGGSADLMNRQLAQLRSTGLYVGSGRTKTFGSAYNAMPQVLQVCHSRRS